MLIKKVNYWSMLFYCIKGVNKDDNNKPRCDCIPWNSS